MLHIFFGEKKFFLAVPPKYFSYKGLSAIVVKIYFFGKDVLLSARK
jgi:hypothetical protein